MKTARIEKVYEAKHHTYQPGNQCETVIRVKLSTGRRCWLVGFGADYRPAKKSEIENFDELPYEVDFDDFVGMHVRAYINA